MRQIVTGLFDTYDDARRAQDALLLKGFAVTDIELPVSGTGTGNGHGAHDVLARLEQFVSSLFASRSASDAPPASPDKGTHAASQRFALQRGAVLIGVRVFDDAHATAARDTLVQQQALQVDEHAPDWKPVAANPAALHEHSALDELGIGGLADALREHASRRPAKAVPDDATLRARYDELRDTDQPGAPADRPADDPAVTALAAAGAADEVPGNAVSSAEVSAFTPLPVPDEFLEYEEDFRGHHATRHQDGEAPFERYQDAYRYGAVLAQDVCNQDRAWSDIEPDARRGWETMMPGAAPHPAWERVRDAVRHGWEHACAQGGGA